MSRYIARSVKSFLELIADDSANYDPLSPLTLSVTIESAKEINDYYQETIKGRDEEIRLLKEVIINMEKSNFNNKKK